MKRRARSSCVNVALLVLLVDAAGCSRAVDESERPLAQVEQAATAPDSNCEPASWNGHDYWFCDNDREFSVARANCQAVGMELVVIEDQAEDDWVESQLDEHSFIGASDVVVEGEWRWLTTGTQFWQGAAAGSPVGGAYSNWDSGEPDTSDDDDEDCVTKSRHDGQWDTHECWLHDAYVCETAGASVPPPELIKRAGAAPWPMLGRVASRSASATVLGPQSDALIWSTDVGGRVRGAPAIGADGTVYVGTDDEELVAVAADGTVTWRHDFGLGGDVLSSPAINPSLGTVYVGSDKNRLHAFDAGGALLWEFQTSGDVRSSPVVGVDGTIYVGSDNRDVYAVNPDGSQKWRRTTGGPVRSSPALGFTGTVYVGSQDNKLYALSPVDGTVDFNVDLGADLDAAVVLGPGDHLYALTTASKLFSLTREGTIEWQLTLGCVADASPALGPDGTIYVGCSSGVMRAITPEGVTRWTYSAGSAIRTTPVVAPNKMLYFGADNGKMHALLDTATSAQLVWSRSLGDDIRVSAALGADGTLYVGDDDERLSAFGLTDVGGEATCNASFLGTTCPCACTACTAEFDLALSDPSSASIAGCAAYVECQGIECYRPDRCMDVIDAVGGPHGLPALKVGVFGQCVAKECPACL